MGDYKSDKKNTRFYGLKLSRNTDGEMIEWLDKKGSVQGYLKSIIKEDMMMEKRFYIKEECLELWGYDCTEDTIVTYQDVKDAAYAWGKSIDELLEQLIEIETRWFVVDKKNGDIWDHKTYADDKEEALEYGKRMWDALSDHDKKAREEFYIALGDTDRYNHLDMNTITETVDIK